MYDDAYAKHCTEGRKSGKPMADWPDFDMETVSITDTYLETETETESNPAPTPLTRTERIIGPQTVSMMDPYNYNPNSCISDVIDCSGFPHFWNLCWPRSKIQANQCIDKISRYLLDIKEKNDPAQLENARKVAHANWMNFET